MVHTSNERKEVWCAPQGSPKPLNIKIGLALWITLPPPAERGGPKRLIAPAGLSEHQLLADTGDGSLE
jgi:hypothetical protein